MLRDDQAAFSRGAHLRLVRENKRPRNDHVSLEPEQRFEDAVPHGEGDAGLVRISRLPSGEQIFVIDEPATVAKSRSLIEMELGGNRDARALGGLVIGPPPEGVDSQEALRELVDGVDRAAQIGSGEGNGIAGRVDLQDLVSRWPLITR